MRKILSILTILIICAKISLAQIIVLKHTYYTCQFDTDLNQGILNDYWQTAAHRITPKNKVDRKGVTTFTQDALIDKKYQVATKKAYQTWNKANKDNRYDIGHIVPYEAMAFELGAAKETMMFNTNTAPQSSYFNEHQWALTEKNVLDSLSAIYDSVHVFTGVLINSESKKMGNSYVPDYYFKVADYQGGNLCFLGLNDAHNKDTNHNDIRVTKKVLLTFIKNYYPFLKTNL